MSETGIVNSSSGNDKTMALDEGMEMTAAIPSKKLAHNQTEVDASSDSESTSQRLEVTRASFFSRRSADSDVTTDVIETLIASDNGKKFSKPTSDETMAGLDEGMEMTVAIPPVVDTPVLPQQTQIEPTSETLKITSTQLEENVPEVDNSEDDDEVTFNAASLLANPESGITSDNVHVQELERSAAERESSSNDEDEEDVGVFKVPVENTTSIPKDLRKRLAERSKSNSSSGTPDDDEDSILRASFLAGEETENDSIFLHTAKPIHVTGKSNSANIPPPRNAAGKASSIEELLKPTPVDFNCVPGYKG